MVFLLFLFLLRQSNVRDVKNTMSVSSSSSSQFHNYQYIIKLQQTEVFLISLAKSIKNITNELNCHCYLDIFIANLKNIYFF